MSIVLGVSVAVSLYSSKVARILSFGTTPVEPPVTVVVPSAFSVTVIEVD